jgi:heme-degrading monooxygenase HmoA
MSPFSERRFAMVKVLIKRVVPKNKAKQMIALFKQMHILAVSQDGYISAETFHNVNDPEEFLVISTWKNSDSWLAWFNGKDRLAIQEKIDALLDSPSHYAVYAYGISQ